MVERKFEYDATRFYDFTNEEGDGKQGDENADKWFDSQFNQLRLDDSPPLRFSDDFDAQLSARAAAQPCRQRQRTSQPESPTRTSLTRKSNERQDSPQQPNTHPRRVVRKKFKKLVVVLPNRQSQCKKTTEDIEVEQISKMQAETKQKIELSRGQIDKKSQSVGRKEEQKNKLYASRKRLAEQNEQLGEPKRKFVSLAEQVERFQKATPVRFRTKSTRDLKKGPMRLKSKQKERVVPKSPHLVTGQRARATKVESTADREEKEIQESGHVFKATALNPNIIKRQGQYGLPQKQEIPITVPTAFHFETRVRTRQAEPVTTKTQESIVAQPMPDMNQVFKPVLTHKITRIEPFKFEGKYTDPAVVREQLSQAEDKKLQEERQFHANLLPDFSNQFVPKKDKPNITLQQSFQLKTDSRGEEYARKWTAQLKAETIADEARRKFKALPCNVIHEAPFEPQHENKPVLPPLDIVLKTDLRAKRWQDLAQRRQQQELENEHTEKERLTKKERKEQEALRELRNKMVHRAQPMPKYSNTTFVVHLSSAQTTDGRSKGPQNNAEHF
ncbi:targeting protein for Xklp2-like [Corticium candelabrum]|uniref:targeting protein for Xklp2-like n=1 Tax=Corticium candelabrum TaxID=121492 RepID=UPI002E2606A6|nr:targeting protein for Xklp2-like [Corticium candelabrum]